ncbi:MAG: EamA/RhaT family transporter [Armatimonadota bacterium]
MPSVFQIVLPVAAAFFYVSSALSLKRASELGAGIWHSAFVSNVLAGLIFQVLLVLGGHWQPLSLWWQPLLTAFLFLSGQIWSMIALQKGDVSIITPVMGVKILMVAVFTTVLVTGGLPWQLWLAAALSTSGIACLNHSGAHRTGTSTANATRTITYAALAAASFALFDVLVQKWSPAWGIGRFLPLTAGMQGLLSFAIIPLFPSPLTRLPSPAPRWLVTGGAFMGLQSLLFVSCIAYFGSATASNVIYSSRGLMSLAAVSLIGHWFHSTEKGLTPSVLRWRFTGATLMFAAIILVLV